MRKRWKIALLSLAFVAVLLLGYRKETYSVDYDYAGGFERYQRYKIFAVPVLWFQKSRHPAYPRAFEEIHGYKAQDGQTFVRPPDYVSSLWYGGHRCYGRGFEQRNRNEILTQIYRLQTEHPNADLARSRITRLDKLIPPHEHLGEAGQEFVTELDKLRTEIGLKPKFPSLAASAEKAEPNS